MTQPPFRPAPSPFGPPSPAARRRAQRIGAGLLLLPVAELAVGLAVAQGLGTGWTIVLILTGMALGLALLTYVGRHAVRRLVTPDPRLTGPKNPGTGGTTPGESAILALAALLLLFPGLLTDLAGIALLLPPVRRRTARRAGTAVASRLARFDPQGRRIIRGEVVD